MKKINIISELPSKLSDKEAFKYYVSTFGAGVVDGFCSNTEFRIGVEKMGPRA